MTVETGKEEQKDSWQFTGTSLAMYSIAQALMLAGWAFTEAGQGNEKFGEGGPLELHRIAGHLDGEGADIRRGLGVLQERRGKTQKTQHLLG